ncbi:MAG TPA: hypothetical protein VGI81_01850 [Tepidisphaeraceae bacterium]|jgi:hypothetical protein
MNPDKSHFESQQSHPATGHEYGQLALWTAAGLAGMVTGMLLARAPFFEAMLKRMGQGRRSKAKPAATRSLPMLASAILGSSKATIQAVFGPPRSVAIPGVGVVVHPQQVYWQSDTWYYPLNRQGPTAVAINFSDDHATKVEFFSSPRIP